jgi:uncharacterized protein YegP (UPF0339 family)
MAHIQVYQERRKVIGPVQYRWRIVARNGKVIAMASEGYHNLADLWHAVNETAKALGAAAARPTVPIHARKPRQ